MEDELDRELRDHLELEAAEQQEQGMPAEEARFAALRSLGNIASIKESSREIWGRSMFDRLLRDVRFGLRMLRHSPGFTLLVVFTLGLGIGATAAIFSVINNVLLNPFPYADSEHLASIGIHDSSAPPNSGSRDMFPETEFLDFAEQSHVFDRVMGTRPHPVLMTLGSSPPQSVNSSTMTGNALQFLGVPPRLGRTFTWNDVDRDAPVVVISYKLWMSTWGGEPDVIGKPITVNDRSKIVIGVMPPRFTFWNSDIWIPARLDRHHWDADLTYYLLLGHIRPDLDEKKAEAELTVIAKRLSKTYPRRYPVHFDVHLEPFLDRQVGRFRDTLYTLLAAVGLLLLIACGNAASLLLARALDREREFAIRGSLGASDIVILRQLFVEGVLVALLSATVGIGLAWGGLKILVAAIPKSFLPSEAYIHLNGPALLGTVAVALFTALLFGILPWIRMVRRDLAEPLKAAAGGNSNYKRQRLRSFLITGEVAVSVLLLSGAGLMMHRFLIDLNTSLGIRTEKLISSQFYFATKYTADDQWHTMQHLKPGLQVLPGVQSVSIAMEFPPWGGVPSGFEVAGLTHSESWRGQVGFCDEDFFPTLGARLLRGRYVTEDDITSKRKVVVVNQTFASKFLAGQDPIGKQIELLALQRAPGPISDPWFEIVGITSDMRNRGIRDPIEPEAYAPYSLSSYGGFVVFLRTILNPVTLTKELERDVQRIDRNLLPQQTHTLDEILELSQFSKPRFTLQIFSVFATVALALVAIGIYSLVSYTVRQRKREIGIRMALGANAKEVRWSVIAQGLKYIFSGIVIGFAASSFAMRFLSSQVPGLPLYDPATVAGVILILVIAGWVACSVPSKRATQVDPLICLRCE